MLNAFLVALAVFICVGGAELVGFTMLNRPIVIGPLVGLFLGDLHTGVIIGIRRLRWGYGLTLEIFTQELSSELHWKLYSWEL